MSVRKSRPPFLALDSLPHLNGAVRASIAGGGMPPIPRAMQNAIDAKARAHPLLEVYASGAAAPSGDAAVAIRELTAGIDGFREKFEARIGQIEAALDERATKDAFALLGGNDGGIAPDREYTSLFASYFRSGASENEIRAAQAVGQRAQIQAAMSVGTNSDGGYLAPVEWDRRIRQAQVATSPMRRLAEVQSTSVGAYSTVWSNNQWGSGWVGETASRPATSSASLSTLTFNTGEIYANVAITQRLLDDAQLNLESWLAGQVEAEFNKQEGIAFISGDGVNKPLGLLQYVASGAGHNAHPGGDLTVTTVAGTTAVTTDELVDFFYSLTAPYRPNASWLMNSTTAGKLAKIKDADGNYIWREGMIADQPATLLGRPVEIDENMPSMATGNMPIAFGDFRAGYLINDRIGTRILRDPFTAKPFVMFYVTKRVGGGLQDPNAIRLLKMA